MYQYNFKDWPESNAVTNIFHEDPENCKLLAGTRPALILDSRAHCGGFCAGVWRRPFEQASFHLRSRSVLIVLRLGAVG